MTQVEAMVRDVVRATVEETVPALVHKLVPDIVHQVEQVIHDDRQVVDGAAYVSIKVAAGIMSAHPATVRKLVADGKLGRFSVEGQLRVKVTDIHAYLGREGHGSPATDIDQRALAILRRG